MPTKGIGTSLWTTFSQRPSHPLSLGVHDIFGTSMSSALRTSQTPTLDDAR